MMRHPARADDLDALRERAEMVAARAPFSVRTALKEVAGTYVDELEKRPRLADRQRDFPAAMRCRRAKGGGLIGGG